jgi:hypothetical protein
MSDLGLLSQNTFAPGIAGGFMHQSGTNALSRLVGCSVVHNGVGDNTVTLQSSAPFPNYVFTDGAFAPNIDVSVNDSSAITKQLLTKDAAGAALDASYMFLIVPINVGR